MRKPWLILLCLPVVSCTTPLRKSDVSAMQSRLKKQEAELQALRDENKILRKKVATDISDARPVPTQQPPAPGASVGMGSVPQSQSPQVDTYGAKSTETTPHDPMLGDQLLYAKAIESYQAQKTEELSRSVDLLEKGFPESEHVDNALYLKGLLLFAENRHADAVKVFERLRGNYPHGNKISASLFAEAMALKKLNQRKDAEERLRRLARLYPGSPEAQRVDVELRILGSSSQQ
jgi:TolA-binding protein